LAASFRTHSTLTTHEASLGHSGERDRPPVQEVLGVPSVDDDELSPTIPVSDGAPHQPGRYISMYVCMYVSSSGERLIDRWLIDRWMDAIGSGSVEIGID